MLSTSTVAVTIPSESSTEWDAATAQVTWKDGNAFRSSKNAHAKKLQENVALEVGRGLYGEKMQDVLIRYSSAELIAWLIY